MLGWLGRHHEAWGWGGKTSLTTHWIPVQDSASLAPLNRHNSLWVSLGLPCPLSKHCIFINKSIRDKGSQGMTLVWRGKNLTSELYYELR